MIVHPIWGAFLGFSVLFVSSFPQNDNSPFDSISSNVDCNDGSNNLKSRDSQDDPTVTTPQTQADSPFLDIEGDSMKQEGESGTDIELTDSPVYQVATNSDIEQGLNYTHRTECRLIDIQAENPSDLNNPTPSTDKDLLADDSDGPAHEQAPPIPGYHCSMGKRRACCYWAAITPGSPTRVKRCSFWFAWLDTRAGGRCRDPHDIGWECCAGIMHYDEQSQIYSSDPDVSTCEELKKGDALSPPARPTDLEGDEPARRPKKQHNGQKVPVCPAPT